MLSTLFFFTTILFFTSGLIIKQSTTAIQPKFAFGLGWTTFAAFWITRLPYYLFTTRSIIYSVFIPVGALLCLIFAFTAITNNDTLPDAYIKTTLSTTIATVIYLPFSLFNPLRKASIELVAQQTYLLLQTLGVQNVTLQNGPEYGYKSALQFAHNNELLVTYIAPNCTGIGSIAVLVSILWITNLPTNRKLLYSVLGVSIIHLLNLGRNVLIALGYGQQWFAGLEPYLAPLLGYSDPNLVSFFITDKILAQFGSIAALFIIFYFFLTQFPELRTALQEITTYLYEKTSAEIKK